MRALLTTLCLIAAPALADSTMTAAEFDAYTRDQTFTYGAAGTPYGAEEYRANRQVRWSFLDGRCLEGEWYEADGLICFTYDEKPEPQCWSFRRGASGLVARFANDPGMTELYEVERSAEPLYCMGPELHGAGRWHLTDSRGVHLSQNTQTPALGPGTAVSVVSGGAQTRLRHSAKNMARAFF